MNIRVYGRWEASQSLSIEHRGRKEASQRLSRGRRPQRDGAQAGGLTEIEHRQEASQHR